MYRILIVDDEPNMRSGLKDNLEFEGYEVETAVDGEEGLNKILYYKYDLVLLDVMMPRMNGFDVCKKVRSEKNNVPIILLTAKGEEIDKVLGLEFGADDYIPKPFGLRELLARVKAVLRRSTSSNLGKTSFSKGVPGGSNPSSDYGISGGLVTTDNPIISDSVLCAEEITIGRLRINFKTYNAYEENMPISMSHKEFELLKYLWERRNKNVSREDLLKDVWGQEGFITTRTIDNFIVKLRQKLEHEPTTPKIIITVHGVGYKLID
ncbi:MAG: response regulator transcription factor [Melioribacteraceae bacterium]|nr:response regulator transcription factor [Melioribacteraceae bacterium]